MEREVSEVDRKLFLKKSYLDKIGYSINRNPISQDELYSIVRKFFGEYLKLDYEFTYEELSQELNKVFINPKVKEHIDDFLLRLSETEYLEETVLGTNEINGFLKELDDIIRNIIYDDQPAQETESLMHKVLHIKHDKHGKALDLSGVASMIDDINFHITNGNLDIAKASYVKLLNAFDTLSKDDRRKLHDDMNEVYERLQTLAKNPNKQATAYQLPTEKITDAIKKVTSLADETAYYINAANVDSAKKEYAETLKLYETLSPEDKKSLHSRVSRLYIQLQALITKPKDSVEDTKDFTENVTPGMEISASPQTAAAASDSSMASPEYMNFMDSLSSNSTSTNVLSPSTAPGIARASDAPISSQISGNDNVDDKISQFNIPLPNIIVVDSAKAETSASAAIEDTNTIKQDIDMTAKDSIAAPFKDASISVPKATSSNQSNRLHDEKTEKISDVFDGTMPDINSSFRFKAEPTQNTTAEAPTQIDQFGRIITDADRSALGTAVSPSTSSKNKESTSETVKSSGSENVLFTPPPIKLSEKEQSAPYIDEMSDASGKLDALKKLRASIESLDSKFTSRINSSQSITKTGTEQEAKTDKIKSEKDKKEIKIPLPEIKSYVNTKEVKLSVEPKIKSEQKLKAETKSTEDYNTIKKPTPASIMLPSDVPVQSILDKTNMLLKKINDDIILEKFDRAKETYQEALLLYKSMKESDKIKCYKLLFEVFKKLDDALHQKSLSEILDKHLSDSTTSRRPIIRTADIISNISTSNRISDNSNSKEETESIINNSSRILQTTTLPVMLANDSDTTRAYELIEESYFNLNNAHHDLAMLKYFKALELYRILSITDKKKVYSGLYELFKNLSAAKKIQYATI